MRSFIECMDKAHEDVIKLARVSVIDFFMESRAEAGWVGCDVGVNELEGVRIDGGVIESLGVLTIFGAEGHVYDYPGIVMMFSVIFF